MQLPKQCQPVLRHAAGAPCSHERDNGLQAAIAHGIQPSGQGVQPNFDWGGFASSLLQTALPAVMSAI